MYLGDPRESLLTPDTLGVLESDNRKEVRYQWGAQILDLCGLSPEDYKNSTQITVKTIVDCGNCGGGGSGETGTTENKGAATLSDDGEFEVSFKSPVATKLYITVDFKDSNMRTGKFIVPVEEGATSASYDISDMGFTAPYEIISAKVGFKPDGSDASDEKSDDEYDYSVDFEGSVTGKTYVLAILCTETDNLTGDDYAEIIAEEFRPDYLGFFAEIDFGGTKEVTVQITYPCTYSDHDIQDEQEEEEFNAEHAYDFIILTQEQIVDLKNGEFSNFSTWEKKDIIINDSNFDQFIKKQGALWTQCCITDIKDEPVTGYNDYKIQIK